jgi:hypothetical protein
METKMPEWTSTDGLNWRKTRPVIGQVEVVIEADLVYTSDEVAAAPRASQLAMNSRIAEILRPGLEAMETACSTVIALGYRPDECLIDVRRSPDLTSETRILSVLGAPCFEVTLTTTPMTAPDYRIEITTTPRLIAWPPAREVTP